MPYHEMRNSITVYLLDFQQYTKRQTIHIVAASRLCSEICFSHPYSTIEPNVPPLKKEAMKRCSDQTMKGKEKIYYTKAKVNEM